MELPDHRRIGRRLKIFASDELCGAGLPLWLPAGAAVRSEIERYIVDLERYHGYQHVYTPNLAKKDLFARSGHLAHYEEDMYPAMKVGGEEVMLRPMNCPHHVLVYASELRSYRDLPVRIAELGTMYRCERSGVIGGLSRVRQMTLNDGHVFCAPEQVEEEVVTILGLVSQAYEALAIPPPSFRLSLKGDGPKYVGDPGIWVRSEAMLRGALEGMGLAFEEAEGEAAFYGPKIDLQVRDPDGREETLSTVQVDLHLPAQFGLSYRRGPDAEMPVMVHRSIVATMERMVAHLLEVHDGALPVWLSPVQVVVLPAVREAIEHAWLVRDQFRDRGLRVEVDDRDDTLGARVRDAEMRRIPYMAVVGRREAAAGTVAVRLRDGSQLDAMPVQGFVDLVGRVVGHKGAALLA